MERNVRDRVHNFCRTHWIDIYHHGDARHRSGHGAAYVDRGGHSAQPALAHSFRARRYSDRPHVFEHRLAALGLLPDPFRSEPAEIAERNVLSFYSLRNADWPARFV